MAVDLKTLVNYCNDLLDVGRIRDYCPNGLQVEGERAVKRIVGGVTASKALIDVALERKADLVLVHHGYFWKGESQEITGIKRQRLKSLLSNDVSLLAYHLPLDVHAELGNNVQLAKLLGFKQTGFLDPESKPSVGLVGELSQAVTAKEFSAYIAQVLGRDCQHIGDGDGMIKSIAWCTGAAQGMIDKAVDRGVDAYLSGEISEPTVHIARECGIHYFAAGHHATERYGVKALGSHLEAKFDVSFEFVDIHNPV